MDTYVDPWEKARAEAVSLGVEIIRYAGWLAANQAAFALAGIDRPPELHATATLVCDHERRVAAVAAVMDVPLDETGDTLVSATTSFGELSVEAYAARWAVA